MPKNGGMLIKEGFSAQRGVNIEFSHGSDLMQCFRYLLSFIFHNHELQNFEMFLLKRYLEILHGIVHSTMVC